MFSIAVRPAVLGLVSLSAATREYAGWLKDTVLKPARKLSLVVTFVPSESAQGRREPNVRPGPTLI